MQSALRKEEASVTFSPVNLRPKSWVETQRDIRAARRNFTDEQIALIEAAALTNWESR